MTHNAYDHIVRLTMRADASQHTPPKVATPGGAPMGGLYKPTYASEASLGGVFRQPPDLDFQLSTFNFHPARNPRPLGPSAPRPLAFTLIEMLVAIAIAAMMLGMIVLLFNKTQQAVSLGIHTGDVLVQSETISAALQHDAKQMIGPSNADPRGFLVIVNHKISGVKMPIPTGGESTKTLAGNNRVVRDDQLIFFTTPDTSQTALTPRTGSNLRNDLYGKRARVWYGHLLRTKTDGSVPSGGLGAATGPNVLGNQWILGRQALLLDPTATTGTTFAAGTDACATNAMWSSGINNRTCPTSFTGSYSSNPLLRSLTDVCNVTLADLITSLPTDTTYVTGTNGVQYYVAPAPPLVYPSPTVPSSATTTDYAWRLAQTHMYLADDVSDFAVDFAGDYNPIDDKIDRDSTTGDIIWYGAFPNNSGVSGYDPAQAIVYAPPSNTFNVPNPTDPGNEAYEQTNPNGLGATATAFVFRHDDGNAFSGSTTNKWPWLLRVRYRLHAPQNQLQSAMAGPGSSWQSITGRWFEQIIKVNRP